MQERLDVTPRPVRMLNQNIESVDDREELRGDGEEEGEEEEKSWREEKFPDFSQLHFVLQIRFQLGR